MAQGARSRTNAQQRRDVNDPALLPAEALWAVWRRVVAVLPLIKMPIDAVFAPSAHSLMGVDYVSGLRRNRSTRRIFDLLAPLAADDLRRVHHIAQINHRRHEVISRWTAIGVVTLPISAALALSELAPELLQRITREWLDLSLTSVALVLGIVFYYLMAAWRARQVATIVELAFIERAVPLDPAAAEADCEPPLILES